MYTLRFPFEIVSGYHLNLEEELSRRIGHLAIKLSQNDYHAVLEISGFESSDDAEKFVERLYAGLMWVMVDQKTPLEASLELDSVHYTDDPEAAAENLSFGSPVHGIVGGHRPSIFPSDKRIVKAFGGDASISHGRNPDDFLDSLVSGVDLAKHFQLSQEEPLHVALELYSAAFAEKSQRARLLTLVTALESIAQGGEKHEAAQTLMDEWERQLVEKKKKYDANSKPYIALDSLERELSFRRGQSLRSQIRDLVFNSLKDSKGVKEARTVAARAVDVYDKRSKLTHEGRIDQSALSEAVREAIDICSEVLKEQLRNRMR